MKSIRIFFTKSDRMRFISHLDMTRFMIRMLRRAKLPIWYTEGFHPHAYVTFALPLSLGFESNYEVMDIRLTEDIPNEEVMQKLNEVFPEFVRVFDVAEPVKKAGKIASADFCVTFSDGGEIAEDLKEFLRCEEITVLKKTKKGVMKELDIAPKIKAFGVETQDGNTVLTLTLPAGGEDNVNPELLIEAFFEQNNYYCYRILRTMISDSEGKPFK